MKKTSSNAKNVWKCIFRISRRVSFLYFPKVALNHGRCPPPHPYLLDVHRSCYNIQYKPSAISKIELFVIKNRYHLETAVDCCYRELRLKCHGAPRSDPETHYNKRNTFLQKPCRKWDQETSSDPLFFWKSFIWGKNKWFVVWFQYF